MSNVIIPDVGIDCNLLDAALEYERHGLTILPLAPGGKTPLVPWKELRVVSPEDIRHWWEMWPDANVGLLTGSRSGVSVIDIDTHKGGSLDALKALGPIPETYTVSTGGGGLHLYFQHQEGVTDSTRKNLPNGIDVRGEGGLIVAPPSLHASGRRYAVAEALPVAPMPGWLYDLLSPKERPLMRSSTPAASWVDKAVLRVVDGMGRNETGMWLAVQLRDSGLTLADATPHMEAYQSRVEALGDHAYSREEAYASLRSAFSRGRREPAAQPSQFGTILPPLAPPLADESLTDVGNAERFAAEYGNRLKHVTGWGWVAFDGKRWVKGAEKLAQEFAKECMRDLSRQASYADDRRVRDAGMDWARKSLSASRIEAMLKLATSDKRVSASVDDFDASPHLLNVKNGTVNLMTSELVPHNAEDRLTRMASVDYEPDATSEAWKTFLSEVFQGDTALVAYVQRALGYSLTGETREQVMFICHGRGENGKSTLLEAVKATLGDYATAFPDTGLEKKTFHNGATAEPELVSTVGARLVLVAEWPEGGALDTRKVKALTGGDTLMIRNLYQAPFEFKPAFALWVRANERPKIDEKTEGIWRRLRLIPFEASFKGRSDKTLPQRLQMDGSAILAWLVQGAVAYYDKERGGLLDAEAVDDATTDYRAEEDPMGVYFTSRLVADKQASVALSEVFADYQRWQSVNDDAPYIFDVSVFGKKAREHGLTPKRRNTGMTLVGWRLSPQESVGGVGSSPKFSNSPGNEKVWYDTYTPYTPAEEDDEAEVEASVW